MRFLIGTSLFVAVLAVAAIAPVTPTGDHKLSRLSTSLKSGDGDKTGTVVTLAPVVPQLPILRQVVDAYESRDRAGGDTVARTLSDPASRAAAEWIAILSAPRQVGFQRINAFLAAYPNWPGNGLLHRRAEEALYNEGADADTIRAFFASSQPETDEGKVALASVLVRAGDQAGAAALIRDAYRNDPLSDQLDTDITSNYTAMLSREDHKFRADRLIYDGNDDDGMRVAARAGADVLALARVRVAVDEGAGNAASLLTATASSDPAYIFAKVRFLQRRNRNKEAAALLLRAPRDAASLIRPDEWWTERRLVARALLDQGDARTAYAVAAGYTAESDFARMEAEFYCGWIALRFLGDSHAAARHFAELSAQSQFPISLSRGAYWQGRAAEAASDKQAATAFYQTSARYPATYYGQLARARLGIRTVDLGTLPVISPATRATFDKLLVVRAITQLYAIDEGVFARTLVSNMAKGLEDSQQLALLGQLALDNRDPKAALGVGKSATQRGLPLDEIAFPTGAIPGFQGAGTVEPAVVYGIARQESEFGPAAVSGAGAQGLMQMMPATAKATAKAAGMAFSAERLATDPTYNAMIGEAHLGELIERFRGSYIMTFAAYNAGPGKVADWVKAYGDPRDPKVDPVDWVERIPYTETRNYVQRVLENVQVYRSRLDGKSALLIDSDLRRGGLH